MFLKFLGKDQNSKLQIPTNLKTLPEFKAELGRFVKLGEDTLEISFVDVEEDIVEIRDDIDFEYMLESAKEKSRLMINVTKSNKTEVVVLEENHNNQFEFQKEILLELEREAAAEEQLACSVNGQSVKEQPTVVYEEGNALHENHGDQTQFKFDDSINSKVNEQSLDLSVIKMTEAHKFETVDTKYDFNKHKTTETVLECVGDLLDEAPRAPKEPEITREALEQSFADSNSFHELKSKIDLVSEIVRQGFSNLNAEIQSLSVVSELNNSLAPQPLPNSQNIHPSVRCNGCGTFPVTGNRFKCLVCRNYDLCSVCEANNIHNHPMLIFYDNCQNSSIDQMSTIFRIKQNLESKTNDSLKIRILKNVAGDKYPEVFYQDFVGKRKEKSIGDFVDDVMKIFG
jgi:hypothetical protein